MPQKTLDELFQSGPPRRDPDESGNEMNAVEKQYVLWGLKEEWEPSRIAMELGVEEVTVRQLRTDFVRNPDELFALDVVEPIEDQGVTMFRCAVCTVHLNSPDQIDRHVLAHFLKDADLDSAIQARLLSERQHEPSSSQGQGEDGPRENQAVQDEGSSPIELPLQAESEENDVASVLPADADRTELLQALRRLAALPDISESPDEPSTQSETTLKDTSKPEAQTQPTDIVETVDMHSAFERMAERRGVSEDETEPTTEPSQGDLSNDVAQRLQREVTPHDTRDTQEGDSESIDRPTEDAKELQTHEDENKRQGEKGAFASLTGWARSANAERQRRDVVGGMGSVKEATSVTIESGVMKILSTRILDVVDYRTVPLSPQLYAGGVVVDAGTISRHLAAALADMKGAHRSVNVAVPGYQSAMRRFDLPDVREIDPKEVIPREARRALGVPVDNATIRWQRLPGRSRIARWLVAAASETSYTAISSVIRGTGHKMRALELRPFPLTRALGHPTVIGVFVSSDGCDVVVVREWEPHTYQSVYWETGSVSDSNDLVRRLTEVVENTIDLHNLHNPEVSLTPDVPMAVTGGELEHHANLEMLVAANVGRNLVEGKNPLNAPSDFPYRSMVVNIGLALWDV